MPSPWISWAPFSTDEAAEQGASNGVHRTRQKFGFLSRRFSRMVSLRMTAVSATLGSLPRATNR